MKVLGWFGNNSFLCWCQVVKNFFSSLDLSQLDLKTCHIHTENYDVCSFLPLQNELQFNIIVVFGRIASLFHQRTLNLNCCSLFNWKDLPTNFLPVSRWLCLHARNFCKSGPQTLLKRNLVVNDKEDMMVCWWKLGSWTQTAPDNEKVNIVLLGCSYGRYAEATFWFFDGSDSFLIPPYVVVRIVAVLLHVVVYDLGAIYDIPIGKCCYFWKICWFLYLLAECCLMRN